MRQTLINALFLIACAAVIVAGGVLSADPEAVQNLLASATAQPAATTE